jgi:hypothetical protein
MALPLRNGPCRHAHLNAAGQRAAGVARRWPRLQRIKLRPRRSGSSAGKNVPQDHGLPCPRCSALKEPRQVLDQFVDVATEGCRMLCRALADSSEAGGWCPGARLSLARMYGGFHVFGDAAVLQVAVMP